MVAAFWLIKQNQDAGSDGTDVSADLDLHCSPKNTIGVLSRENGI
jgi:hypothetical protein